ncbi:MAG: tetratricopeptide repeat protein [Cyclobacteriaceae bacterium]
MRGLHIIVTVVVYISACAIGFSQSTEALDHDIAQLYALLDDPLEPNDSIQALADALKRSSATSNYELGVLVASYMHAQVLYRTNQADSAIAIYNAIQEKAIAVANGERLVARLAQALGAAYQKQGSYDLALKSYQEALMLSTALGSWPKVAVAHFSLGFLHSAIGDSDKAFDHYMNAADHINVMPPVQQARLYNALGTYYSNKNLLDSSRYYYQLGLDIHRQLGDLRGVSHGYNNLAIVNYLSGDIEAAIVGFQSALKVRLELGSPYNISDSYYNIGYLNADMGRHVEAIRNYRLGLKYARLANSIIAERDLLLEMSASFEKLAQFDSAYYYLAQGRVLADSVMNETKQNEILALEKEYETNQLLARQEVIEKEKALTTYQRNALLVGLIAILIIGSVGYYIQQLRYKYRLVKSERDRVMLEKETELAQKEVNLKQEQIANFTNQLIHKNELLEQLQQQIEQKQLSAQQSASFIGQHKTPNLETEHDWLNFKIEFEMAYPGFFNSVISRSSDITPHDQRLASLMRVALSNKEIGHILNISSDSVVKAKYRLRQKLGFESQSQLDQFIQEA